MRSRRLAAEKLPAATTDTNTDIDSKRSIRPSGIREDAYRSYCLVAVCGRAYLLFAPSPAPLNEGVHPMSRISTPATIDATPEASRPLLEAVRKQLGVAPNLFRMVANSPA